MYIQEVNEKEKTIKVAIPLTSTSGKIRIKKRTKFNDYGKPVATRQTPFTQSCYVEWQIGYDVPVNDNKKALLTTSKEQTFIGANGKTKYLYELSEYIKYFYMWGVITKSELLEIKQFLQAISPDNCLDKHHTMAIKHSDLIPKKINDIDFFFTVVESPVIIHDFGKYEIIAEIQTKEKQHAIGRQPMLYFCFPITELDESEKLLGRVANPKEIATFTFNKEAKSVFLDMLKIFGILTYNHKQDVISIINLIIGL